MVLVLRVLGGIWKVVRVDVKPGDRPANRSDLSRVWNGNKALEFRTLGFEDEDKRVAEFLLFFFLMRLIAQRYPEPVFCEPAYI